MASIIKQGELTKSKEFARIPYMKTITITSKGQITIPASVRKAWGIKGAGKVNVSFDKETRKMVLEQPMTVDQAISFFDSIPRKKVQPLTDVHEYYARERTKEIVRKMRKNS